MTTRKFTVLVAAIIGLFAVQSSAAPARASRQQQQHVRQPQQQHVRQPQHPQQHVRQPQVQPHRTPYAPQHRAPYQDRWSPQQHRHAFPPPSFRYPQYQYFPVVPYRYLRQDCTPVVVLERVWVPPVQELVRRDVWVPATPCSPGHVGYSYETVEVREGYYTDRYVTRSACGW